MNNHYGLAFAAVLLAAQGGAWAADGTGGGQPPAGADRSRSMLERGDADRDGKVSRDEFKALHEKRTEEMFRALDAGGDGYIDADELQRARESRRERMQKRQDAPQQ